MDRVSGVGGWFGGRIGLGWMGGRVGGSFGSKEKSKLWLRSARLALERVTFFAHPFFARFAFFADRESLLLLLLLCSSFSSTTILVLHATVSPRLRPSSHFPRVYPRFPISTTTATLAC